MNAPMMLPWLARKWNVGQERTLELWRQACTEARSTGGEEDKSAFWGLAKDRWIDLLDQEVMARHPVTETPWIMMRLNFLRLVANVRFWIASRRPRLTTSY